MCILKKCEFKVEGEFQQTMLYRLRLHASCNEWPSRRLDLD